MSRDPLRRRVCLGVLFVALITASASAKDANFSQALEAKLEIDRSSLSPGNQISITGIIKNISPEPLTVCKRPLPYPVYHLNVADSSGISLRAYKLVVYAVIPETTEDFVELKPAQSIFMRFSAILLQDDIAHVEAPGRSRLKGLFLNFKNSAFFLPQIGRYEIKFKYDLGRKLRDEWQREFGFKNLWYGHIESEPVPITIQ